MINTNSEDLVLLSALSENFEAIYYVDFDENIIRPFRMSPVIEEKFGDYFRTNPSYEDAMNGYIKTIVYPDDQEAMFKRAVPEYIKEKLRDKRAYAFDFRVKRNGSILMYRFKVANLDGIGELHRAVVGFADVTPEVDRINELIESHAMMKLLEKDSLTGLYSKEFFFKNVEQFRENNPDMDLLLWTSDVRGLKVINEKYGMDVGDEVLKIMAANGNRMQGFLFGGRVEGDKLSALVDAKDIDWNELPRFMSEYNRNNGIEFPIPGVVIKHGVYRLKKNDSLRSEAMYDRTVLAINSIKNKFGVDFAEYNDKLKEDLLMNRQIMERADSAMKNGEFCVYYQPKIDLNEGVVSGAEALVRWINPEYGFMSPGLFIPVFEQNGFITKLDFYMWEEVCKAIVDWEKRGIPLVPVSVNVSRYDFDDDMLAEKIISLVDKYGVDHSLFQIEITESSYSDNPEHIQQIIKTLHDNGFNIALDDFGTGYSSMIALSSLDIDIMKLDMSLIQNDVPGTDKNVLEFSMQLAHMMQLKTVAEGVETKEQVERIRSLGGDFIQGYFYSKPLPQDQFEAFVQA